VGTVLIVEVDEPATGTIQQASFAFGNEPVTPLPNRFGIDPEPVGCGRDRLSPVKSTRDHPASFRGQRRIRMLGSSMGQEPSRV
jgi:hypothetical protein